MPSDCTNRLRNVAQFLREADFPSHPETTLFKSEYYPKSIKEKHIWTYYDLMRSKLLLELKGYPLFIYIATNGKFIIKRHAAEDYITVSNKEEYDKINNGRIAEFHIATPPTSNKQWVDIDPGDDVPFSEVKEVTFETADAIRDARIQAKVSRFIFTGSRGFYIELGTPKMDTDKFREEITDVLKEYYEGDEFVVFKKPKKNQVRIDFTPIKRYGGHRATFSLAAVKKTGLVCMPLARNEIKMFKKEQAKMPTAVKRFTGKSFRFD